MAMATLRPSSEFILRGMSSTNSCMRVDVPGCPFVGSLFIDWNRPSKRQATDLSPLDEVMTNYDSPARSAVREHIGFDVPLMVYLKSEASSSKRNQNRPRAFSSTCFYAVGGREACGGRFDRRQWRPPRAPQKDFVVILFSFRVLLKGLDVNFPL
ncbi:hypothetical protein SETIT_7G100700v2 [Setaria italica]|uniref:Uncharacterized protein n=1 Tax=Setaria italica TaxID=4555 RepID=A0A368RU60_SETIT|nr:hypothetical protein SETIT_7G100700v2 [Setaria italica]